MRHFRRVSAPRRAAVIAMTVSTAVGLTVGVAPTPVSAAPPGRPLAVTAPPGYLTAVSATSTTNVWAVGYRFTDTAIHTLIMRQGTAGWAPVASPNPSTIRSQLSGVKAISANNVWAVGEYGPSDDPAQSNPLIAHWNGTTWSAVSAPRPNKFSARLNAVSATSASNVWAVGFSATSSDGYDGRTLVMRWNGSKWSIVPSPSPSPYWSELYGVTAVSANDAWAVGTYSSVTGPARTLTLHWNGSTWQRVSSPIQGSVDNLLVAVSGSSSTNVWAVGWSDNTVNPDLSASRMLLLRWNGAAWSKVAGPTLPAGGYSLAGVSVVSATLAWAVGTAWITTTVDGTPVLSPDAPNRIAAEFC